MTCVQSARHLGLSQLAALLAIGLAQQRYAFINMSIIRWFTYTISLEMHLFTWSHLCSASATRNFVHSVSTLFEIILLVLLGNDLSTITRGNGVKHFHLCQDLQLIELLAGGEEAVALGLVGFASVLAARLLACIITSSIITRLASQN